METKVLSPRLKSSSPIECQDHITCFRRLQGNYWSLVNSTKSKKSIVFVIMKFSDDCLEEQTWILAQCEWTVHHDHASGRSALNIRDFYTKDMTVWHLATFLFPKLKSPSKGQTFDTIKKIKHKSLEEVQWISESTFSTCFRQWQRRRGKCVTGQRDILKGTRL